MNRRGDYDYEELVKYIGWIAFAVLLLGALYLLRKRFML